MYGRDQSQNGLARGLCSQAEPRVPCCPLPPFVICFCLWSGKKIGQGCPSKAQACKILSLQSSNAGLPVLAEQLPLWLPPAPCLRCCFTDVRRGEPPVAWGAGSASGLWLPKGLHLPTGCWVFITTTRIQFIPSRADRLEASCPWELRRIPAEDKQGPDLGIPRWCSQALAPQLGSSPRTLEATGAWYSLLYSQALKPETRSLRFLRIKEIDVCTFL